MPAYHNSILIRGTPVSRFTFDLPSLSFLTVATAPPILAEDDIFQLVHSQRTEIP